MFYFQWATSKTTIHEVHSPNENVFVVSDVGKNPQNDPKIKVLDVFFAIFCEIFQLFRGLESWKHSTTIALRIQWTSENRHP